VDVVAYDRGRAIGFLERALIYFFVLGGHYEAVGLVLVAKAFAQFRRTDDRASMEYVLIGTLLSSCLAIAVGELVNHLSMG
jgi:Flp pilus assembly pilin Flp